jgi:cation transport ATPase
MRTAVTQSGKREADAIFSLLHVDRSLTSKIEQRLRKISGIRNVMVDFVTNTVLVSYDPDQITIQDIRVVVEKTDLDA